MVFNLGSKDWSEIYPAIESQKGLANFGFRRVTSMIIQTAVKFVSGEGEDQMKSRRAEEDEHFDGGAAGGGGEEVLQLQKVRQIVVIGFDNKLLTIQPHTPINFVSRYRSTLPTPYPKRCFRKKMLSRGEGSPFSNYPCNGVYLNSVIFKSHDGSERDKEEKVLQVFSVTYVSFEGVLLTNFYGFQFYIYRCELWRFEKKLLLMCLHANILTKIFSW